MIGVLQGAVLVFLPFWHMQYAADWCFPPLGLSLIFLKAAPSRPRQYTVNVLELRPVRHGGNAGISLIAWQNKCLD